MGVVGMGVGWGVKRKKKVGKEIRECMPLVSCYVTARDNLHPVREREEEGERESCLLYTSPSPRDMYKSRMPSSA